MSTTLLGYNIILKATIGGTEKKFLGVTSNSFSISPETKDSITKDDEGVKRKVSTGYSWEAGVEGIMMVNASGETSAADRNDIIELVKAGTSIAVVYGQTGTGSKVQKGTAIATAYSESTDSENEGTFSLTLGGTSKLTTDTLA